MRCQLCGSDRFTRMERKHWCLNCGAANTPITQPVGDDDRADFNELDYLTTMDAEWAAQELEWS